MFSAQHNPQWIDIDKKRRPITSEAQKNERPFTIKARRAYRQRATMKASRKSILSGVERTNERANDCIQRFWVFANINVSPTHRHIHFIIHHIAYILHTQAHRLLWHFIRYLTIIIQRPVRTMGHSLWQSRKNDLQRVMICKRINEWQTKQQFYCNAFSLWHKSGQ